MRKNIVFLMAFIFPAITVCCQDAALVTDKENLFTGLEITHIDSLLQAYHKKSGNLVAVYTDSADISANDFGSKVYALFKKTSSDEAYSFILMMSRTHSHIFSTINNKTVPYANQQQLIGILETGFVSLKEKRREEAVIKICTKAMEFLDSLPGRKTGQ